MHLPFLCCLSASAAHGTPSLASVVRRACGGDKELGQLLTHLLLENEEFRLHSNNELYVNILPSLMSMLRSKEGAIPLHVSRSTSLAPRLTLHASHASERRALLVARASFMLTARDEPH